MKKEETEINETVEETGAEINKKGEGRRVGKRNTADSLENKSSKLPKLNKEKENRSGSDCSYVSLPSMYKKEGRNIESELDETQPMSSTVKDGGNMMEINLERDLLSPTSQADPLNDTNKGELRSSMSEDLAMTDLSLSENPLVSIQLESVIKAAKDAKKKAARERRNKKKTKVVNPDENKDNAAISVLKDVSEATVKPSMGQTDMVVSKSANEVTVKPSKGLTDKSNAAGVRLRK